MKFPVPKTLTGASSPMILINWLFGYGVIQYPIGKPRPAISAFWSIVNVLTYLSFVVMANFDKITELQESKIGATSFRINAYICVVFIIVSMCFAHTRAELIWCTFAKLNDMNGRLKILGIPNDYESVFKAQIIQLCAAFTVIFTIVVLDFKYVGFVFPSAISRLGFFMSLHHWLAFAFIVDCSFGDSVRYFGNRFKHLNTLLIKSNSLERSGSMGIQSDDHFSRCYSVIHEIHGTNASSIRAANKQWLLYLIRETRMIHRGLCKMATELNRGFGVQVLLSVALSISLIITVLYISYRAQFFNTPILEDWLVKMIALMWITFYATKVLMIVDACETTSHEAHQAAELIAELLNTAAGDEDIRDEINIFLLQLLQNPLIFTANGFFTFNYALVHGIVGSVTTYLIIMIQMRNIYEPENTNYKPNSTMLEQTNGMD